jgi:hypothetical protein
MDVIRLILGFFRAFILRRTALVAENLALRQQLAVLLVSVKRPRILPQLLLTPPGGVTKMRPKMACNMCNMVHM